MKPSNAEYVVFDVETTGLSPKSGDKIIELGAVKIKHSQIVDTFETFINPHRDIPIEAQRIHNISSEMVLGAPDASEILPDFIQFIGGAGLVGHNVKFDLDFVCCELALIGRKLSADIPAIDTLKMSKHLLAHLRSHRLSYVAHNLGVMVEETHRALADVKLTAKVFLHLLDVCEDQGIGSFYDFHKLYGVIKPSFPIQHAEMNQHSLF